MNTLSRSSSTITPSSTATRHASSSSRPSATGTGGHQNSFTYPVPSTKTTLRIYTFRSFPLNSQAFLPLLQLATTGINHHIQTGGPNYANHWLLEQDDPLVFQYQGDGAAAGFQAFFYAESQKNEQGLLQHLTYGIMQNVVRGLSEWAERDQQWYGCRFEVEHGRWGAVGRGVVLPGELPAVGVVDKSEAGEVEWFRGLNMTALVVALGEE